MNGKVLVTGGDGMLDSNLVRELQRNAYQVSVLKQNGRITGTLDGLNITVFEGDLLDPDSLDQACSEQDYIIHAAACTRIWPARSDEVNRINVEGTRNMLDAALRNGVNRLIYIGTANSFGAGSKEYPGVEGNRYRGFRYGLDYMDSKYLAHQLVLEYVEKGLDAVILNPTFMLGAYDSAPGSGVIVISVVDRKVPGYPPGGRNYICVRDVAVATVNAIEKGRTGESYILGHENLSYKELCTRIGKAVGLTPPSIYMPKALILVYGWISDVIGRLIDRRPSVSFPMAKIACDGQYYSAKKAIAELGLPQTPVEVGIMECYDWLNDNGYLKHNNHHE